MDTPAPMAPAATPDIPLSRPALARSDEGQGLALDKNPDLEAATARNFDAQASISKARAAGTFDIEMPDGTTWSAEEILAELDADARTDFQITFCTTNSGGAA